MMKTIRARFLRGTALGNGFDAMPGDVAELDPRTFAVFAQQGRVVEVRDEPEPSAPNTAPRRAKGK